MNKSELIKKLEKYYYSHGQHLIVDTWELMEDNIHDCCFDVYLADSDISLFTLQNYNGFDDIELLNKSYFKKDRFTFIKTWDGVRASCTPLYLDGVITLKTFKQITKEDIVHATDYFVHEILDMMIFNIKFNEKEKDEKV